MAAIDFTLFPALLLIRLISFQYLALLHPSRNLSSWHAKHQRNDERDNRDGRGVGQHVHGFLDHRRCPVCNDLLKAPRPSSVMKAKREAPCTAQQPKGRVIFPDLQAGPNEQSNRNVVR